MQRKKSSEGGYDILKGSVVAVGLSLLSYSALTVGTAYAIPILVLAILLLNMVGHPLLPQKSFLFIPDMMKEK